MAQAYDFALEKIGLDIYAYTIWNDYIAFLKSLEAAGSYAENQKIAAVRKVYQKGIMTPMISVEIFWKDYCAYEMSINPILGKSIIESCSRNFANVKRITKELESLTRPIDRNNPCIPPNSPPTSEEVKQLSAWRKFISWERSNPLRTDDRPLLARRILLAYEQALLCFGYHVDLWHESCSYLEHTSRFYAEHGDAHLAKRFLDETAHLYERAIQSFMRSNMLIHFAYADFEESRLHVDKARAIYNHLLDPEGGHLLDPTLAYIQAMRFERRTDGIKSARTMFKRAREDPRIRHQIYIAAALMEYYCTKDTNIAYNIFNLGLKKYPQNVDYLLAYLDYMTHLNEDQNARVLFERILAEENSLARDSQVSIWNEFLKFESQIGDLPAIKKIEQRRLNLFTEFNQLQPYETSLLIDRYKFLDLYPCPTDELKLLGLQDHSQGNDSPGPIEQSTKDRRALLPRPDIKHLMPYRPTRDPLPGSHPTPGGIFPLPDTALYLVKVLPPPRNFEGPFVVIDQLMDLLTQVTIPETFEPVRISIQGEAIRDFDLSNSQSSRKTDRPDSDEDDHTPRHAINGRSAMNIYQQRQQKRAKLAANVDG